MPRHKLFITLFVAGLVLVGAASPVAAHDTQTINGYELTFGGADEPVITSERMWLELEIIDAETEEPVEGLEYDLEMAVQRPFGDDAHELEVDSRYGEPGWYEAAALFTEPGVYTVYINGSIDGSQINTTFNKQVHNAENLQYPPQTQEGPLSFGINGSVGFGLGVVLTTVAMASAFLVGRRRQV